jgi:hypothetical protein
MMEVASERADARRTKQQAKDAQALHLPPVALSEKAGALKFKHKAPGQIVCGTPPAHARTAADDLPPKPWSVASARKTPPASANTAGALGDGGDAQAQAASEARITVDGEAGKCKRVTAERYVDCYLNGGKVIRGNSRARFFCSC